VTNTAFLPLADLTPARRQAAETGTLVTGSERLRREYIYAYDYARMSEGKKAWQQPSICSFDALVRRDYEQARAADNAGAVLLSPVQQHALVRDVAPENLQHLTSLFEEAWGLVHAWQLDYRSGAFQASENTRSFVDWADRVSQKLVETNAITSAQLADQQYDLHHGAAATESLRLTGFDVLTAQQRNYLERTAKKGVDVHVETANSTPSDSSQGNTSTTMTKGHAERFISVTAELTAAIQWARERIENPTDPTQLPRIAIVVPNLLGQHAKITRLLHNQLEGNEERTEALYNIGGGLPLAQHPLVESALGLLASVHQPTHFSKIEQLLADPALPAINTHTQPSARILR